MVTGAFGHFAFPAAKILIAPKGCLQCLIHFEKKITDSAPAILIICRLQECSSSRGSWSCSIRGNLVNDNKEVMKLVACYRKRQLLQKLHARKKDNSKFSIAWNSPAKFTFLTFTTGNLNLGNPLFSPYFFAWHSMLTP